MILLPPNKMVLAILGSRKKGDIIRKQTLCFIILFGFLFSTTVYAAFEDLESGVRPQGMGGAFTAVADDASAIHFNPACLFQLEKGELSGFYKILFGGVDGLHNTTIDVAFPMHWGTLGFSLQEVGSDLEKDRVLTFSHGFKLTKDLSFGYNLLAYNLSQERFGSATTFGIDLGFLATVYKRWRLGCFAHNLNNPQMGKLTSYSLPRLLNLGISYTPWEGITSSFDLSKEVGYPTRIQIGQEFTIIEKFLILRAGLQSEPLEYGVRYSGGFRTGVGSLHFDYALTSHEVLPFTHQFAIGYKF